MASTDQNDSSKNRTKPLPGVEAQPSGFETLRPDQAVAPFAETVAPGAAIPVDLPSAYGASQPTQPPPTQAPTYPSPPSHPAPRAAIDPGGFQGAEVCGYRLGKLLGRGGFGKVFLGEAPGGIPVAVKIVEAPRDSKEAAERELEALKAIKELRHSYLLSTHAFHPLDDQLVIIMELADGSLRDELEKGRREGKKGLPPEYLARLILESAEAVDYLHDKKMTHRDIKPENILLLSGHAKLADFGLVRVVQENRGQASVSLTGTLAYMAPEVFRGHTHKNSDQYALALTYLELRFGERFVTSNDLVEAMLKHVEHEPDLSRLEPHEQEVIKKALAKDPEQRWRSCTEMARALAEGFGRTAVRGDSGKAAIAKASPTRAVTPQKSRVPSTKYPGQQKKRNPLVFVLGGVAALAVLGVVAFLASRMGGSKSSTQTASNPSTTQPNANIPPNVVLPRVAAGWKLEPGQAATVTDEGKEYYNEIDLVLDDATRLRFILVPQRLNSGPIREAAAVPAFYMMRDKVSYELFQRFAKIKKPQNSQWEQGVLLMNDVRDKNPQLPVMGVTVEDALRCCEWLGGDLPSLEQWRKAAGFYNQRDKLGPFDVSWQKDNVGINRPEEGPLPVNGSTKDLSMYGIRDMAGNGKEWTHTMEDGRVPKTSPGKFDMVTQVGKSFREPRPMYFTDLMREKVETAEYGLPDDYCGFRAVLNLP